MHIVQTLLKDIQTNGIHRADRTGTGIQSVFGRQLHFDTQLGTSFPAITLRKFPLKTILHELLWFIKGTPSCDYLDENNVKIWKQWTEPHNNTVGKMYGVQLRNRPSYIEVPNLPQAITFHEQQGYIQLETPAHLINHVLMYKNEDVLQNVIKQLKTIPNSRRHVTMLDDSNGMSISLWNHDYLPDEKTAPIDNVLLGRQTLANCHGTMIQFNVNPITEKQIAQYLKPKFNQVEQAIELNNHFNCESNNTLSDTQHQWLDKLETQLDIIIPRQTLSLQMYQRSADVPTAIGFNVGQYAILLYMVAHLCNMLPDKYIHTLGDAHIYDNQHDVVREMLEREPLNNGQIQLNIKRKVENINDFTVDDFELIGYTHYDNYLPVPVAY